MLAHEYYPNRSKSMRNSLKESMKDHYNFMTAYENLLFDEDVFNSDSGNQFVNITGETVSSSASADTIWQFIKRSPEYNIVHLLNLTNNDDQWRNEAGAPILKTNLETTVYIGEEESISNIYVASPDMAVNLDYMDLEQIYVSELGNVIGSSVLGDSLTLTVDNGALPNADKLIFDVLQSGIVKVSYRPNDIAPSPDTPKIDPNKTWSSTGATIDTSSDPILITTSKMKVEIAKTPTRVTIKKADGTTLLWEPSSGGIFNDGIKFRHESSQNIYGIGSTNANEAATDITRNMSTEPAHAGHQGDGGGPFMWSTSGYGILVDSDGGYPLTHDATGTLEFTYGSTPTEGRRYNKSDLEYYAIVGDPDEIIAGFAEITGKSPLMPKWSLGFMNFEWGTDQTETLNNIDTYRAKNIPIDSYALDYDWKKYGEDNYIIFSIPLNGVFS